MVRCDRVTDRCGRRSRFFAVLVEAILNLGGKAEGHSRSLSAYQAVVREARILIDRGDGLDEQEFLRLKNLNEIAGSMSAPIPESRFLQLKQKHLKKVALSKLLDERPSAPIWLMKIQLLIRDSRVDANSRGKT